LRENLIEKALKREVEARGGMCPKWVSPGLRGVPDRMVITADGRTMYVETKAPGKPLSPLQAKMIEKLRARGHVAVKLDSVEDVKRFAAKELDRKRGDAQ